jgi:hypothetical protein
MQLHGYDVYADKLQVVIKASVQWTWKVSKKSWREDFTCTIDFDELLKVKAYSVKSNPPEENCIMRAIDECKENFGPHSTVSRPLAGMLIHN